MTDANKAQRTADYRLRNFGGTSDWAVDLQQYTFDYDYEPEVGLVWDDGKMVLPDCTGTYSTLEDIANAGSSIPNRCGPLYVLKVVRTTLANTLKTYQEIIDDGYDEKFGLYADAVVAAAPQAVKDFYMKHGSSYFSCEVMEAVQCCGGCWRTYGNNSPRCKYCKGTYDICKNGGFGTAGYTRVPEICPPDTSQIGAGNADLHTIYWTLLPDKKAQFFADLLDETGLAEESIIFTSYNLNPHDCRVYPECFNSGWHFGAPGISKSYGTKNVVNPKDIIAKALKEVQNLPASIDSVIAQIEGKTYKGDTADLVDALGLPVLMVEQAVQSMIEVAKLGSKIAEEKKKALILLIISAILFVIPVFGGALGAINGLATLGRIISLFGEVGFIAMDLYDIVDTPANAPLIIFGAILGAGALTDAAKLSKAAQARRGMTGADLKKLGGGIDVKIGKIDNIIKVCRKK
jgi:chitinase